MAESREQHITRGRENIAAWKTHVGEYTLGKLVKLWHEGDKKATASVNKFADESDENHRLLRKVERLYGDGSFFPGNHRDFDKLPDELACTMCPAFHGVINKGDSEMTISCEWPDKVQEVRMKLENGAIGGAIEIKGNCRFGFGIS